MNFLDIWSLAIVIGIIIFVFGIFLWIVLSQRFQNHNTKDNVAFLGGIFVILGLCIAICATIGTGIYAIKTYNDAVSLPYQYRTACDTVTETSMLLMRYDNISNGTLNSLGYGLEANELKLALKDAIVLKNQLHAEILSFINNPLTAYQDVIRNNLPEDFR
jgi:heme/copper-type cytochrome/quinol oxidase subunit 2